LQPRGHVALVPSPRLLERRVEPRARVDVLEQRACARRDATRPQQLLGDVEAEHASALEGRLPPPLPHLARSQQNE